MKQESLQPGIRSDDLPPLYKPILSKVSPLKHLAVPVPMGGGCKSTSHAAATGLHWKI